MNLDDGRAKAQQLRDSGAGDGDILLALNRAGLTASDAEEIVRALPGKNRASVDRVGPFELRMSKFGVALALVLIPIVTLFFSVKWFAVAILGVLSAVGLTTGINGLGKFLRGESPASVDVRPHFHGIPMPFTVKTHPLFAALSPLGIGLICAYAAIRIAVMIYR
jgi:hypothetical protein